MAHFGSALWPKEFGPVAYLNSEGVSSVTGIAASDTTLSSTVGVDYISYTVPTAQTGMYRISSHLYNHADDLSGGTHLCTVQITYNDGAARTVVDLGAVGGGGQDTITNIDFSTADVHLAQRGVIQANAGTAITVAVEHILNSTVPTAGTHDIQFSIEKIS